MYAYVIRRLLATIPVMGVVAVFVFLLLHLTPGDPATVIAGDYARPEDIARIRSKLGLDRPLHIQFVTWVGAVVRGDLGESIFSNLPVTKLIAQRIEPTLALSLSNRRFHRQLHQASHNRYLNQMLQSIRRSMVLLSSTTLISPGRGAASLAEHGEKPLGVEGLDEGRWVLLDFGDAVVHVFQRDVREHYDLDRLWSDAPVLVPTPSDARTVTR